jgi:hypothetical protein
MCEAERGHAGFGSATIVVIVILFDDLRERVYVGGSTALLVLVRSGTIGTGVR